MVAPAMALIVAYLNILRAASEWRARCDGPFSY